MYPDWLEVAAGWPEEHVTTCIVRHRQQHRTFEIPRGLYKATEILALAWKHKHILIDQEIALQGVTKRLTGRWPAK